MGWVDILSLAADLDIWGVMRKVSGYRPIAGVMWKVSGYGVCERIMRSFYCFVLTVGICAIIQLSQDKMKFLFDKLAQVQ